MPIYHTYSDFYHAFEGGISDWEEALTRSLPPLGTLAWWWLFHGHRRYRGEEWQ